jgi:hypothetical protein
MPAITKPIHSTPKPTNSAKVGLNNNNRPAKSEPQNLSNGSLTSTPGMMIKNFLLKAPKIVVTFSCLKVGNLLFLQRNKTYVS